ncbi:hypothetical protein R80B4_00353 [Fibrobacteres bacterium R8-0-B4]
MMFFTRQGRAALLIAAAVGLGLLAAGCGKKDAPATDAAAAALADPRDGQKYKTAVIGGQTWMAENLNYQTESGSWCYGNSADSCAKYGRLYDWNTAKTVCPDGWKLPSYKEWMLLSESAGGAEFSGKRLKSTSGWNENGNGTDDFGFSAMPGGERYYKDGNFGGAGGAGIWWTATEYDDGAGALFLRSQDGYLDGVGDVDEDKNFGYSVRCLKVSAAGAGGQRNAGEQSAPPDAPLEAHDMPDAPLDAAYNMEIDYRDGQQFLYVSIGNQEWMTSNLNYETGDSWCYGNDNSNCEKYGRLYTWDMAARVCPKEWRLPTREDWQTLVDYVGGNSTAGKKLKSKSGWANDGNGMSEYGFWALPGGVYDTDGRFYNAGAVGYWWTATEDGSGGAYRRDMHYDGNAADENGVGKGNGYSVRCVRE